MDFKNTTVAFANNKTKQRESNKGKTYATAAAIVTKVVSGYNKVTMCCYMRLLTAPPVENVGFTVSISKTVLDKEKKRITKL